MAARKSFLLRIDPEMLEALRRWASDDLRSVNAQMEFLLRRALLDTGRLPKQKSIRDRNPRTKTRRRKQPPG